MRRFWKAAILATALLLGGCEAGSNLDSTVATPGPPPAELSQSQLDSLKLLTQPVPTSHRELRSHSLPPDAQILSLADLESDYETLFYPIVPAQGLTANSPHAMANANFIKSQSGTGFFDVAARPILNNPLGVTGVAFEPIPYDTTVTLPHGAQTFHVSGGLLLPLGIDKTKVKGVVVYFHGGSSDKSRVGSNPTDGETQLAAALFATQGYIVVMPDMIGQGSDFQSVHPYLLYPETSVRTALDMLAAVKARIIQEYTYRLEDVPVKLFSVGYAEGANYALWLAHTVSRHPSDLESFYRLTHSVGMEGPYRPSTVTLGYLYQDVGADAVDFYHYQPQDVLIVNLTKPVLLVKLVLAYANYTLDGGFRTIRDLFEENFFQMIATFPASRQQLCLIDGRRYDLIDVTKLPHSDLTMPLFASAAGKGTGNESTTYPPVRQLAVSFYNSVQVLAVSELQTALAPLLQAADVKLDGVPDRSVSLMTLSHDSSVSPNHFDQLSAVYPSKIDTALKLDETQLQLPSPYYSVPGTPVFVPADFAEAPIYEFLYTAHILGQH